VIVLDDARFESPLEEVSGAAVRLVEPNAITDAQPLHRAAEVCLRCLDEEVEVIIHKGIRVEKNTKALRHV